MPSKLQKAIGAVKDQTSIGLARVNSSSNLQVAVLRATTHHDAPIDERYVYEVLQLVSSNKIYAASCARAIGKRITRTRNWIVALKSLILVLRIFQDGDPYFPREVLHAMKRGAKILNLSNFRDDSTSNPWDYTAFVRTFALYLDERLDCFLTGKLQRRYTHNERLGSHSFRRQTNESVRDMKPSMLLDRITYWQRLLERTIATRPTGSAKHNRLVQISLYAVVKESFDLYKDVSDGLGILLESFFHLQHQSCVGAFEVCVKASKQFEELSAFYSSCQSIGVGRTSEYPSVQTISDELIETLREFLKDQSSFPTRSPSKTPSRHKGQSQFSDFSTGKSIDRSPEFGSQGTSLEDLISATENGKAPSISIDLEAYSDQFEKRSQQEESFRVSCTGSTRSLPVTNSFVDLLSLDDWPVVEERRQHREQERKLDGLDSISSNDSSIWNSGSSRKPPRHRNSSDGFLQSSSGKDWEVVLAESVAASPYSQGSNFGDSPNPQKQNCFDAFYEHQDPGANESWELALAGTPNNQQSTHHTDILSNTFDASTAITLYNEPQPQLQPPLPPTNHYNPFLDDPPEISTSDSRPTFSTGPNFPGNDPFSPNPTFQTTAPSFWAQNRSNATTDPFAIQASNDPFATASHNSSPSDPFASGAHKEDDPFATEMSSEEVFNQQELVQRQQQLWLQNQNKIIDRHRTNV